MTTPPSIIGTIALRDRVFRIKRAEISRHEATWCIEIETDGQEFDRETWAPYLYHQGLLIDATVAAELQHRVIRWLTCGAPAYSHPEIAAMYVFGHHVVGESEIAFGGITAGRIELLWTGLCDVFCDVDFKDDVPFRCSCLADIKV